MEEGKRNNLRIAGSGSASGGVFQSVTINGRGEINGDLDCFDIKVSGSAEINGRVKCQTGKVSGGVLMKGDLEADEFKVSGNFDIHGGVVVKEIKISGAVDVKGGLTSEEVEIRGGAKVKGDLQAEVFSAKGTFDIGGLLNAGIIEISLYGPCQAREIGGEKISVKNSGEFRVKRFIKSLFLPLDLNNGLTTDTIEGDDIDLEYTKAKVVRGNNINLGPGCDIELVEYRTSFQKAPDAKVGEHRKAE